MRAILSCSLALVTLAGCDSDDPATDSGTPPTNDTGMTPATDTGSMESGMAGACANAADGMRLQATYMSEADAGSMINVSAVVRECTLANLTDTAMRDACITRRTMLSMGCTNCVTAGAACATMNCLSQCSGTDTAACTMCACTNCAAAFTMCAGVPMSACI